MWLCVYPLSSDMFNKHCLYDAVFTQDDTQWSMFSIYLEMILCCITLLITHLLLLVCVVLACVHTFVVVISTLKVTSFFSPSFLFFSLSLFSISLSLWSLSLPRSTFSWEIAACHLLVIHRAQLPLDTGLKSLVAAIIQNDQSFSLVSMVMRVEQVRRSAC